MPTDNLLGAVRLQTTVRKRRQSETAPYEVIEDSSWHDAATGEVITDPERLMRLNTAQLDSSQQEPKE